MEARCPPGQINISETVAGHVKALFELQPRGTIKAKQSKAKHERRYEMFFLSRLKPEFLSDADRRAPSENALAPVLRLPSGQWRSLVRVV